VWTGEGDDELRVILNEVKNLAAYQSDRLEMFRFAHLDSILIAVAIEIAPVGRSADRPPAGTERQLPSPQGDDQPQAPAPRFQPPAKRGLFQVDHTMPADFDPLLGKFVILHGGFVILHGEFDHVRAGLVILLGGLDHVLAGFDQVRAELVSTRAGVDHVHGE
jgi:hypothetical protein